MKNRYARLLLPALMFASSLGLSQTPPIMGASLPSATVLPATALIPSAGHEPSIFISADDGFQMDIVAGFRNKKVPVILVTDPLLADYTLTANTVTIHQESTGGKIARCLFAYCAGIADSGNVSVELVDNHSKAIVWGYNVTKQTGQRNRQSMAEAIAKHFNHDFMQKDYKNASKPAV